MNSIDTPLPGMMTIIRRMIYVEGYKSFYRGIGASALKAAPATGVTFTVYSEVMRFQRNL